MSSLDKDSARQAYEAVRDDKNDTNWAVLKYDGNTISVTSTGTDFEEFRASFDESERAFGYVRVFTGDELSKRAKFVLLTWSGNSVNAIKRARMSIDKGLVKEVFANFAIELTTSDSDEISEEHIKEQLKKAGGANYGTGVRD